MGNVTCLKCGADNPREATFCGGCGASLVLQRDPSASKPAAAVQSEGPPAAGLADPPPHQPYSSPPTVDQNRPPDQSLVAPPAHQPPDYRQTYGMPTEAQKFEGNPDTSSWSWAGCLPYGIFAFANGNFVWGCFAWLPILNYVYPIYIGLKGRELAWQNRAFASAQQFEETMRVWSNWGFGCFVSQIVLSILLLILMGIGVNNGMMAY